MTSPQETRILAVSSPGSRWAELNAIVRAIGSTSTTFVCTGTAKDKPIPDSHRLSDFSLFSLWKLPIFATQLFWLVLRTRPQLVISTGAAPGVVAMVIGRLFGARCVWVESLTSTETISLSGRIAGRLANLWLTQWPDLASDNGPQFRGGLI